MVIAQIELIRCQLLDDEAVKRQVFVERSDDVIPVHPGPGEILLEIEHVALVVRVARHVQPMSRPAFAIVRRFQQLID